MTEGERARRAEELFHRAVDLPDQSRAELLERECAGDEALFHEVQTLLNHHRTDDSLLAAGPGAALALPADFCGPYRLVRKLDEGGMGTVYLASRDDGQFRRRVAIKVVTPGLDEGQLLARFGTERQALAVLDHPNIVKLLDAGNTQDGRPFIVMDYVEGLPIDRYCQVHALTVEERIRLILKVCAAVQYAHQNLVVHRDLKPTNILVTHDGEPKLLDFGIAKLLRPEYLAGAIGVTRTRYQPMTLHYASPEQVGGQPITTASDVYSLGVVLYELLAGCGPYAQTAGTLGELETAIREQTPPPPSKAVRRLPGMRADLDTIVLMALRKEPSRRYASVDRLAVDLRCYLEARPVSAHKDSLAYRLRTFTLRRRSLVVAATLTALALVGAAVFSWRAAVDARAQRAKAELLLAELRTFPEILFLMDDAAKSGTTEARRRAAEKVLPALQGLARVAGSDTRLRRDLVEGYLRLGDLQSSPYAANVGDLPEAAAQSYRAAREIAEALQRDSPNEPVAERELARVLLRQADLTELSGDHDLALGLYRQSIPMLRKHATADAASARELVQALLRFGQANLQDPAGARSLFEEAGRWTASLPSPERPLALAVIAAKIGQSLVREKRTALGLEKLSEAKRRETEILAADPGNGPARHASASTHWLLADAWESGGRPREALEEMRRSIAEYAILERRDPENLRYRREMSLAGAELARLLAANGHPAEAQEFVRDHLRRLDALANRPDASFLDHRNYAYALLTTPVAAFRDAKEAARQAELAFRQSGGASMSSAFWLGLAQKELGQLPAARESLRRALALLPPLRPGERGSHDRAEVEEELRQVEKALTR